MVVDVYADWCGPCKTLAPVLEEAAMRSGGAFHLVKINSDRFPQLSELFGVKALPSVFALQPGGSLTDNFVGMPNEKGLRSFFMGLLTGKEAREPTPQEADQGRKMSKKAREKASQRLRLLAGAAALGSDERALLDSKIRDLIDELPTSAESVKGARVALRYLDNAMLDMDRFGSIPTSAGAFAGVAAFPELVGVLGAAGFEDRGGTLALSHRNPAVIHAAQQQLTQWLAKARVQQRKAEIRERVMRMAKSPPQGAPAPEPGPEEEEEEAEAEAAPAWTPAAAKKGAKGEGGGAEERSSAKERLRKKRAGGGKAQTLAGADLLGGQRKKDDVNEYFGGDSTVFLAAEKTEEALDEDEKEAAWEDDVEWEEDEDEQEDGSDADD